MRDAGTAAISKVVEEQDPQIRAAGRLDGEPGGLDASRGMPIADSDEFRLITADLVGLLFFMHAEQGDRPADHVQPGPRLGESNPQVVIHRIEQPLVDVRARASPTGRA